MRSMSTRCRLCRVTHLKRLRKWKNENGGVYTIGFVSCNVVSEENFGEEMKILFGIQIPDFVDSPYSETVTLELVSFWALTEHSVIFRTRACAQRTMAP